MAMSLEQINGGAPYDLASLQRAFEEFTRSSAILEEQQRALRERVAHLDVELAESHDELERSLGEQRHLTNEIHNVLENLTSGVIAVDPEGCIQTINSTALQLLGLGRSEDLLGKPVAHTVGTVIDGAAIASLVHFGWEPSRTFECSVEVQGVHRRLRVSGNAARDVDTGEPRGGMLVIEDITALADWRERAVLNERLGTMGRVAAEVAHEIRNPLGSIELLASSLASGVDSQRASELGGHIVGAVRSLNALVSNILTFSRGREPEVEAVAWERVAEEALDQCALPIAQAQVRLEMRWHRPEVRVLGDAELLSQVLVNLITNAAQALESATGERLITLETGLREEGVWLRVGDTGPGVEAGERAKIFQPFVTTRRRGTGLGLAIVQHIVTAHGGTIACGESPEGGALFEISLPRADAAAHRIPREGTHG